MQFFYALFNRLRMSTLLCIETSTQVCSCTLSQNGEIILNKESFQQQSHATLLGVFVNEIMGFVRENNLELDAVGVSSGPGSYTGLRIGVSQAKGLSFGLDVPLISLSTPEIMADMAKSSVEKDVLLCPMIDARRMEVYATFFDASLNIIRKTSPDIVDENSYRDLLNWNRIVFFGNGSEKCKTKINHPNASFLSDMHPLASGMVPLAEKAFAEEKFENSAYFEPFYLKEFVATIAKAKL